MIPELSAFERMKNLCTMLLPLLCAFIFDQIFFIFAGKKDSHKSLDEFEFRPDPTSDCELAALERLKKSPKKGKVQITLVNFILEWLFFIFAGNNHKTLIRSLTME